MIQAKTPEPRPSPSRDRTSTVVLSRLVSFLRSEDYKVDADLPLTAIPFLILRRSLMLARGLRWRLTGVRGNGALFVGRAVILRGRRKLQLGRSSTIGDRCIIDALSRHGANIGNNFTLGPNSVIECTGVIRSLGEGLLVGDRVGISANAFLSVRGKVQIGSDTIIGPGFSLHSENHVYHDPSTPIRLQGESRKGIAIGANCWIGANVTVLDGVTIHNGCVIGAGSVVTTSLPPNSIAVGVPARAVRNRLD